MADLQLPNGEFFDELRSIQDSHRGQATKYVEYLEEHGLGLIEGYLPYVESLKHGFIDRRGETREFSASAWNGRIAGAKHRIIYAFDRSEHAGDLTKRARLKAHIDSAPTKQKRRGTIGSDKYLDWKDVKLLLERCRVRDPKLAPIIEFLARTGCRIAETIGVRLNDIKINGKTAYIRIRGKGGVERTVTVDKIFIGKVAGYYLGTEFLFEHSGHQYNPRSITNRIKTVSEIEIGKRVSAHALRHSYARHQVVDLHRSAKAVARQLGHSSTSITMDFYVEDEPTGDPMMPTGPTDEEVAVQNAVLEEVLRKL